jgi:ubiquinone/menaquinone biosynthesis C-methylase UbiE
MIMKDLFSTQANLYHRYRPDYPDALFRAIVDKVETPDRVWDCATGNGQAACALAKYFKHVIATDLSENQIANAKACDNVNYRVATSDHSGLTDGSVDCVTVAQALHWFDNEGFYDEVRRVLKPGGLFAAWLYALPKLDDPNLAKILRLLYHDILGGYWDVGRQHIDDEYRDLYMPFDDIKRQRFEKPLEWTREDFIGFLSTWSALQTYLKQHDDNPLEEIIRPQLEAVWPDNNEKRTFRFQFVLFSTR